MHEDVYTMQATVEHERGHLADLLRDFRLHVSRTLAEAHLRPQCGPALQGLVHRLTQRRPNPNLHRLMLEVSGWHRV